MNHEDVITIINNVNFLLSVSKKDKSYIMKILSQFN